jgi:hypothetical protein
MISQPVLYAFRHQDASEAFSPEDIRAVPGIGCLIPLLPWQLNDPRFIDWLER